ncbi:hypothetical protein I302_102962 [Kwoniella bestiolae CBS 10118]|uniref:BHLH domain-containing protein n=1 Tax=Kwoniella bestiolae CBS 10118 TaxID=1296100 RepID=A0A1B9GGH1_9TREE|nr:hypothetical protein I302_01658 [Kwoniella bestiolae CBS 10118]OCF30139.1 hypothetical protein I302_01658 [Kwoniella bestiolae CBS 10118]
MTSPVEISPSSSRPIDISPPKKSSGSSSTHPRNHYYHPTEEKRKDMTASASAPIPINIPRMPPSSSSNHHRDSYERPTQSRSSRETRGESPSSGRSPTISHSYTRSHPYSRRTSSTSQPEREQERDREREPLPRIHLPPPNSIAPLKFSSSENSSHQLSPIEREFPSLSTSQHDSSSWRGSDRPQVHRIPSGGSLGKSSGISLPPLQSISGSPTLPPPPPQPLSMPPPSSLDSSSGSTARESPRMYPPNLRERATYNPYETAHQQRRSPSAGPSKLRGERERVYDHQHQHQLQNRQMDQYQPHDDMYEPHRRPSSSAPHIGSTVPLPNDHPSSLPPHRPYHPQGYDISSPPLRALPPSSMPPMAYVPPYGHRGGGVNLARSRSQSATAGYPRPGPLEGGDESAGGVAPTPGQTRRLAHLMSEQKRRESINSGFQALRQAIPSSLPTDSKAIILRKAVSHITHLEDIIRRSGITYSDSPPGLGPPHPLSEGWSNDVHEGRERDMMVDEDEVDQLQLQHRHGGPRIKWEDDR